MIEEAIIASAGQRGAVQPLRNVSDVEMEVFFLRQLQHLSGKTEKYGRMTGRSAWLEIGSNVYLVAAASMDENSWIMSSVPIPFAMMPKLIESDRDRMLSMQLDVFAEFFDAMKKTADRINLAS